MRNRGNVMIKICHIISGDLWAGAEVMAYYLLKGLKGYNKLSLSAILLNKGKLDEEIRKQGIRVYVVEEHNKSFFNILMDIRNIIKKLSPDVLHSHRYKENIIAFLISRSIRGLKLIATQHGLPEVNRGSTSLKHRMISRWNLFMLSKYFYRVVVVSQDIKELFEKKIKFDYKKISIIHNGIMITDIPPKLDNRGTFVIGSAGRVFPVKDYPFMVEIANEVLKKTKDISFQLAGDGPDRPRLEALIKRYGIDRQFVLKGHLSDMSEFYKGLNLYLNTSIHEGIPMSILEAMAHGLPVIAQNVGGLHEIVDDGIQGYLVNEKDPGAFADKCILLYKNKVLWKKMSQAAREKVARNFSVPNMAQQYHNLYTSVVSKG